jgi:dienelactone hydrolase
MLRILTCLALSLAAVAGETSLTAVDYQHDGVALRGTLALPVGAAGPLPGVLVVQEWWGRNAYADRRARELAEAGYAAFALDMYGAGKVTMDPKQAGEWAGPFYQDRGLMVARARAGLAQLKAAPGVDGKRLSAIGFCFGGTVVLELARAGEPLMAVASFHGGLKTPTKVAPGGILAKLLILHGGADSFVPPEEVAGFIAEMTAAKADWRMEIYGSATHAFSNPDADLFKGKLPIAYDPDAERRSFAALHALLK